MTIITITSPTSQPTPTLSPTPKIAPFKTTDNIYKTATTTATKISKEMKIKIALKSYRELCHDDSIVSNGDGCFYISKMLSDTLLLDFPKKESTLEK